MAVVSFTIPDDQTTRVIDAFATAYAYQPTIPNPDPATVVATPTIPNPETRAQFMRRQILEFVRNVVQAVEATAAAETARQAEIAKPGVDVA